MNRETVIRLLEQNEILPANKFGQNFLCDDEITSRIVEVSGIEPGDNVLEVGPGLGALTEKLIKKGCSVTAVEIDHKLADLLPKTIGDPNLRVIDCDFLKVSDIDLSSFDHAISNIPYYAMTPIMMRIISEMSNIRTMTFMVEDEAINRIAAKPKTKQYGPLSVLCSAFGTVKREFTVPKNCFYPMPHTTSAVITIKRHERSLVSPDKGFMDLVTLCFSQRRKKLVNNCPEAKPVLASLGLSPDTLRAEDLTAMQYLELYDAIRKDMI